MDVRSLTSRLSRATDPVLARHPGVTVLIYHRVGGGTDSQVDLLVDEFDRQLAHLAEHSTVISLDAAVDRLQGVATDEAVNAVPAVVITFDDGTADFVEHAVPALVRHGLPATLYVASSFVDTQASFPWGAPPVSWAGLRDAVATGLVTIGSHTHTHPTLGRASSTLAADELDRSIASITAGAGVAPQHFAYPKAVPGSTAAEIEVRRRFRSAALARSRTNVAAHADVHRLSRTPIQRRDGFDGFIAKAAGGMRLEGELRALLLRGRSAVSAGSIRG